MFELKIFSGKSFEVFYLYDFPKESSLGGIRFQTIYGEEYVTNLPYVVKVFTDDGNKKDESSVK